MKHLLAALLLTLVSALPVSAAIANGSTNRNVTFDGVRLRVDTYRPNCANPDILIDHHGSSRSWYPNGARPLADRECLVVVAPIFSDDNYNSRTYQRGGVVNSSGTPLAPSRWTVRLERFIVDWAKAQIGGTPDVYIFGFSAGGQYLSRVAAYAPVPGVKRYVVGSPSSWVGFDLAEDMPYGFDRLGTVAQEEAAAQAYLALPLTVYVGSEDDDPDDDDLGDCGNCDGEHRLARAREAYNEGQAIAQARGWAFNWTLVIADGVGHSGTDILRAPEVDEAFGFGTVLPPPEPPTCTCEE